jgi:hypothetical protein
MIAFENQIGETWPAPRVISIAAIFAANATTVVSAALAPTRVKLRMYALSMARVFDLRSQTRG